MYYKMGITTSELKDTSALQVVGSFIISQSSVECLWYLHDKETRNNSIKKLVIGAVLYETGKYLSGPRGPL
jgi:hypothetical protein